MFTLQTIWFLLLAVLFIGYAVLDGFDLGVGVLSVLAKDDNERGRMVASVGPFWDGNEVWLLTGGGAIFAAFPDVYATVFSGFYLALMLLLAALILRAVSVEFWSKVDSPGWRNAWTAGFFLGSLLPAILLGVAFGNILHGVPVDAGKEYAGTFFTLLNPYSILVGVLSLVMFVMHGALYLALKTDGELKAKAIKWAGRGWAAFVVIYLLVTALTAVFAGKMLARYMEGPLPWILVVVAVAAIIAIKLFLNKELVGKAFIASSVAIASLIGVAAVGLFPNLVPSTIDPAYSLTVVNSSNSQLTLTVMLILVAIGVPIMLIYTAYIYRCFRGKSEAGEY
jgi:cytochrome bd ubiquinol oxidase subunit II